MVQSIKDYSLQNISNRINLRRSQTSILYIKFPVFLRWRAMHENARKGLHESTQNCWSFFQDVNLERQSPLGVFLRDRTIFDFIFTERRGATFVTPVRVHKKCDISMYFLGKAASHFLHFLGKAASHFLPREKISCFRGKSTIFPDKTIKIKCQRGPFWKDHLFRKFEENIIFPCIFLRKIIFHFPSKV